MYSSEDVIKILKKIGVELPSDLSNLSLVADGYSELMDSLQVMQLFMEIEDLLGITIDQEEINPDNLENVGTIVAMMNRLAE